MKTYDKSSFDDDFEYVDDCMVNKELARIHREQEIELMKKWSLSESEGLECEVRDFAQRELMKKVEFEGE